MVEFISRFYIRILRYLEPKLLEEEFLSIEDIDKQLAELDTELDKSNTYTTQYLEPIKTSDLYSKNLSIINEFRVLNFGDYGREKLAMCIKLLNNKTEEVYWLPYYYISETATHLYIKLV